MPEVIVTPNGALPLEDARPPRAGYLWSFDGRREVKAGTVAAALELNLFCIHAYAVADAAMWYASGENGAPDLGELRYLARLDMFQALRTLCALLPIMADAYEDLNLTTSTTSEQFGDKLSFAAIVSPAGEVLRTFPTPEDWRVFGAELEREYLTPAGIYLGGSEFGALPVITWVAISLVAGLLGTVTVAWAIGRVTAYASLEMKALQGRIACFDAWAEEYAKTGSPEAREAMLLCHEQMSSVRSPSLLSGLWPVAGLVAIVGGVLYYTRKQG